MKRSSLLLPLALSVIGLSGGIIGYGARHLSGGPADVSSTEDSKGGRTGQGRAETGELAAEPGRSHASKLPEIPHKKSDDTVESLLALDPGISYGRVAVWLAGAGEEEIAALWAGYQGGTRTNDMTDLILLNWTRVNPQGAIAALAGTKDEHYAWWAWAAHDPKKALAEAMANNPDRVNNVTWGIGEFHPEWLRENINKLPENSRGNAMAGMRKWTDRQDPEGSLDFMRENKLGFDRETFLSLVRKDPWAAQDWLKRNSALADDHGSGDGTIADLMMNTIARERPEDLERMLAAAPPGEMRRKMEQVLYDQLVAEDPEAALEQARKGEIPLVKVQQLAQVAMKLLQKDPGRAFALAGEMLDAGGGKLGYETRVEYGNGSSSWGGQAGKAHELVDALFAKDPDRTLALVSKEQNGSSEDIFSNLVSRWSEEDLVGLSEWTNRQADMNRRDRAAAYIANQLTQQGEYEQALEWAGSLNGMSGESMVAHTIYQWSRKDPAGADTWLEGSELPDERKQEIRRGIERTRNNERNN